MNIKSTEKEDICKLKEELSERRPLPIGRTQFMEWSDRIIQAAEIEADPESVRFSLGAMLMQLGPTEAFREDGYFVLCLRKSAANQTAHAIMTEIKEAQRAKDKQAEEESPPNLRAVDGLLENKEV